MINRVKNLAEIAESAVKILRTFDDEDPDLIKTGLGPIDETIGGLFPGQGGILGLANGVGKSMTILNAMLQSDTPQGAIFVEDTDDVMGTRCISHQSGVNSLAIRRKDLTDMDKEAIQAAINKLRYKKAYAVCHPGASIETIEEYVEDLAKRGCRLIWLDYIQKVRGIRQDRNNEVAEAYTRFQRACFHHECAFMVASQFSRQVDPTKRPRRSWLKESGDLENEARVIVLGWRDEGNDQVVHYVLDKSTVGGEGLHWAVERDTSGILRPITKGDDW